MLSHSSCFRSDILDIIIKKIVFLTPTFSVKKAELKFKKLISKSKAIQKLSYLTVNIEIDLSWSSIIFEKYVRYCPKMKSKKHNHLFLHLFSLPNLFTTSTDDCLFLQSILTGIFHVNIPLNNLSSVVVLPSSSNS